MCWSHHGHVSLEDLLDELVLGRVDELDDVGVEAVSVFLQEAWKEDREESIKDKVVARTRAPDCGAWNRSGRLHHQHVQITLRTILREEKMTKVSL